MERYQRSSSSIGGEPPTKTRRSPRACLQCRARKQKCILWAHSDDDQSPCRRCKQLGVACSFTVEPPKQAINAQTPSGLAEIVTDLRSRAVLQEERIAALERRLGHRHDRGQGAVASDDVLSKATIEAGRHSEADPPEITTNSTYPSQGMSFDQLDIAPPIATLRSLGAVGQTDNDSSEGDWMSPIHARFNSDEFDPITQNLLTADEVVTAFQIFFDDCHSNAPLLDNNLRASPLILRRSSPRLLLALCSIGTRYWTAGEASETNINRSLHPKYFDLLALLDRAIACLLLKPDTADVNIESLQILLLYAQWMPCGRACTDSASMPHARFRNRYNDFSAWAILGLAARYAKLLNIEQHISGAFHANTNHSNHGNADVARLRAYNNLLTCDYNLMLSSGLPASVNPTPAVNANEVFLSSKQAQYPDDARIAALVQLVSITHRATETSADWSSRKLAVRSLRKANLEFEEWDQLYSQRLGHTPSQHLRLPFNSARWYRLALNSASLGPLLSSTAKNSSQRIPASLLESLEISLTAASQILLALTEWGEDHVYQVKSQDPSSLPNGPLHAYVAACDHLLFGVDSTWISITFAVTFIILCFIRGVIDDDLSIVCLSPSSANTRSSASLPRSHSLIVRLLQLGNEIFDSVCEKSSSHPAYDFRAVVRGATSLVLPENPVSAQEVHTLDATTMQAFSDLMGEVDMYWPGNLFDLDNGADGGMG